MVRIKTLRKKTCHRLYFLRMAIPIYLMSCIFLLIQFWDIPSGGGGLCSLPLNLDRPVPAMEGMLYDFSKLGCKRCRNFQYFSLKTFVPRTQPPYCKEAQTKLQGDTTWKIPEDSSPQLATTAVHLSNLFLRWFPPTGLIVFHLSFQKSWSRDKLSLLCSVQTLWEPTNL